MIKYETHKHYIAHVSNDTNLQVIWKPKIGDMIIAKLANAPTTTLWAGRTHRHEILHCLNASDMIFLTNNSAKKFFAWIPKLDDMIDILEECKDTSTFEVLSLITNAKGIDPEALIEEIAYSLYSKSGNTN